MEGERRKRGEGGRERERGKRPKHTAHRKVSMKHEVSTAQVGQEVGPMSAAAD